MVLLMRGWGGWVVLGIVALLGAGLVGLGTPRPVAYCASAAVAAAAGWFINSGEARHTIFAVPVQWVAVAIGVAALFGL